MKSNKLQIQRLLLFTLLVVLTGCTPSTRILGSWKSPETAAQNYRRIVVVALTDNLVARQEVESDLQMQLKRRGIEATKSIDLFPPTANSNTAPTVDLLIDRIKAEDQDAILTAALVDEQTETRYVPGTMAYRPMTRFMWYGSFRGYYTYWYPTLYDPGYYTEEKVYYLETNLYDTQNDRLVWSAQSKSHSPRSMRKAANQFAELTVQKMAEDNVLPSLVSQ